MLLGTKKISDTESIEELLPIVGHGISYIITRNYLWTNIRKATFN